MFSYLYICLLSGIALVIGAASTWGQPINTFIRYPADGDVDVGLRPTIHIVTTGIIDVAGLSRAWPDAEVQGWVAEMPSVVLIESSIASRLPQEKWARYCIPGVYNVVNGGELMYTPTTYLRCNTEYRCVINRVKASPVLGGVPVAIQRTDWTFRTRPAVPGIATLSLAGKSVIGCRDTVKVSFTSDIRPFLHLWPRLIRVERALADLPDEYQEYPMPPILSEDGTTVLLSPPDGWMPGDFVRVHVNVSAISGEDLSDLTAVTQIRRYQSLRYDVVHDDGTSPPGGRALFDTTGYVVEAGRQVTVTCPSWFNDTLRFTSWRSDQYPAVDGITETRLNVTMDCAMMEQPIMFNAMATVINKYRIPFDVGEDGKVEIRSMDGELISTVEGRDTLELPYSATGYMICAVPNAGHTANAWSYFPAGIPAAGIAAVVNTAAIQNALNNTMGNLLAPGFGITFQTPPFTPNGTETYSLRAKILNVSRFQDIDVDAMFTTNSEFEDVAPGRRRICVTAGPCWEIIGYSSSTLQIWPDDPVQNLCVDDDLLNPRNEGVFVVQPKMFFLHVERVYTSTDDPTSVVNGKVVHPDAIFDIYLKGTKIGETTWTRLTAQRTCITNGVPSWEILVPCNGELKFAMTNAPTRGVEFKYFAEINDYAIPSGGIVKRDRPWVIYEYYLTAIPDLARFNHVRCTDLQQSGYKEIRIRACYRRYLAIEAISLRLKTETTGKTNPEYKEVWFDPLLLHDVHPDDMTGGRQLQYMPRIGTKVRIRFNMELSIPSIDNGGIKGESYGNLDPNDVNPPDASFNFESNDLNSFVTTIGDEYYNTVELDIRKYSDLIKQTTYLGQNEIIISKAVTALDGSTMLSPFKFLANTIEAPGWSLNFDSLRVRYDGDAHYGLFDNYGDLYFLNSGSICASRARPINRAYDHAFKYLPECSPDLVKRGECYINFSDKGKQPLVMNGVPIMYSLDKMYLSDVAIDMLQCWDLDCGNHQHCLTWTIGELLGIFRLLMSDANVGGGASWVLTFIVEVVRSVLLSYDADDFLGEAHFVKMQPTVWGFRDEGSNKHYFPSNHVDFHLSCKLYPPRAIIR